MILLLSDSNKQKKILEQAGYKEGVDYVSLCLPLITLDPYLEPIADSETIRIAQINSLAKIRACLEDKGIEKLKLSPQQLVIVASETVVLCENKVLPLPFESQYYVASNQKNLGMQNTIRKTLQQIRDKRLDLLSVLCFAQADNIDVHFFTSNITQIKMKEYSDDIVERYLKYINEMEEGVLPFAIDGRGVALVESISGSYTAVLGFPVQDFYLGLQNEICIDRVQPRIIASRYDPPSQKEYNLRLVAVGDIYFNLGLNLGENQSVSLAKSSYHEINDPITRGIGGDAALFAAHSRRAGFSQAYVLGSIGDDHIGVEILEQLSKYDVSSHMISRKAESLSDISVNITQQGQRTNLTMQIVDKNSFISIRDVDLFEGYIKNTDLLFISARCFSDNRQRAANRVLKLASKEEIKTILYLPPEIETKMSFDGLRLGIEEKVTIAAIEINTLQIWLNIQSDILVLPEEFSDVCKALIIYDAYGETDMHMVTKKERVNVHQLGVDKLNTLPNVLQTLALYVYQLMAPKILLASRGPSRRKLLRQIVPVNRLEIVPSNVNELNWHPGMAVDEYLKENALLKARWVRDHGGFNPHIKIILGIDTNSIFEDRELGQPLDDDTAKSILESISGKTHYIKSGIAIIDTETFQEVTDCVTTEVKMRRLTSKEIDTYIQTQEPIGKAGAYAIQGLAAVFIESINGSYSNVVGLPLERITQLLEDNFGISIWDLDNLTL